MENKKGQQLLQPDLGYIRIPVSDKTHFSAEFGNTNIWEGDKGTHMQSSKKIMFKNKGYNRIRIIGLHSTTIEYGYGNIIVDGIKVDDFSNKQNYIQDFTVISDFTLNVNQLCSTIEIITEPGTGISNVESIDVIKYNIGIPLDSDTTQLISKNYETDNNVIRKDFIGSLEDCTLATYEVLETSNKVTNNEIQATNLKTLSIEKFIFE